MKDVEKKLRRGMDKNGISLETQEKIVQSITSFALYGFPESHAASFALLAYASAYLKCHYLAAFTAAMLNNQPMGFYNPATLVKDAQRHGLRVKPIDVTRSDWLCTLEQFENKSSNDLASNSVPVRELAVRLGLRYVKGLRADAGAHIVQQRDLRPLASIEDLKLRVPILQKDELTALAEVGALNFIAAEHGAVGERSQTIHRRDALWQIERAARRPGPLLEAVLEAAEMPPQCASDTSPRGLASVEEGARTVSADSPLLPMTVEERLRADFRGTGITVGPHPLAYHRAELKKQGVRSASELPHLANGVHVCIAGAVIARQRPGTAKGFVFLSLEDETGIANAIFTPQIFEKNHLVIVHQPFLFIAGQLQNQENVVSIKAATVRPLSVTRAETASHDFH